ncbi:MAG TPA: hypothetical protein VL099_06540 [Candidatus Binatia bacterium]|nr:hypothetical protein [Candidatus Binatia bacterium]
MRQPKGRTAASDKRPEESGKAKKPYQKPVFRHERVFETMALSCGKMSSTQGQCRFNAMNS